MIEILYIIGGGMVGLEVVWQVVNMGVNVVIYEMCFKVEIFVYCIGYLVEMVCLNFFCLDDDEQNVVGFLYWEMCVVNGLIMVMVDKYCLFVGGVLVVDCDFFVESVIEVLIVYLNILVDYGEIIELFEDGYWIIVIGFLIFVGFGVVIQVEIGVDVLVFFDVIVLIVYVESINMDVVWLQFCYDKGDIEEECKVYFNCLMIYEQYEVFIDVFEMVDKIEFYEGEIVGYFDGCLLIEVMVECGCEILCFGLMKFVGLINVYDFENKFYVVV